MRPSSRKRKKNKSKKPWIIAAIVLLPIIILGSGGDDVSTAPSPTIEPTATLTPVRGETSMVDYLIDKAKHDAGGEDAEAKANAAFEWIVSTAPQWYDGPEIMEQAIYNGTLVEYFYYVTDRVRSDIGMDTVQAVKYVYRGIETVLDDATQENIRQIKEGIEKARGD